MQTSKCGSSVLITSPNITFSRFASGVPCTRFVNSAAIRGSISTAVTDFAALRISTVKLPVPGPTSRTWSVCFRLALCTIAVATPGFLSFRGQLTVLFLSASNAYYVLAEVLVHLEDRVGCRRLRRRLRVGRGIRTGTFPLVLGHDGN
jgi:hypothetical protein